MGQDIEHGVDQLEPHQSAGVFRNLGTQGPEAGILGTRRASLGGSER